MAGRRRLLYSFLMACGLLLTSFAWPAQISVNSTAEGAIAPQSAWDNHAEDYAAGFHRLAVQRGSPVPVQDQEGATTGFWAFDLPPVALASNATPTITGAAGPDPGW